MWCRSDYAYAQEPVQLAVAGGERREITQVLRRWHSPEGPGFRVVVGGQALDLRYVQTEDRWVVRPAF